MIVRALSVLLVLLVASAAAPMGFVSDGIAAESEPATLATATSEAPKGDAEAAGIEPAATETAGDEPGGFLSYQEETSHSQTSFAGLMLRLVLSMVVILGLIYGGLMLFRLLARNAKAAPKAEKLIRIIDRAALDPKRAVYLVKVVDRLLVIGVGTNEVRTLAQIDDETIVENVQETEFTGHLQSLLGRFARREG
ncbi:MAG: flagellar biosynthetic protein FliO [Verrucomicrobia bacterium]|nr:flagellar biosynthetic protein FliO [Verrucomicrobiota bacterium]